ncbi:hypothetical protein [Mangrovihabitans endophyticus]|uniref:Uncharacterized protein n=1 Tax=Mangrovihabitans endophyticus TaxID=1751298 RepID=A0A8J3FN10_9ACTN|nr:hypothetical protein [Mangrovihabitans endophyticus]GGK77517.1 hypothetical protein GCM10012284_09400 [Mangrovihabitans endophyticus]
MKRNGPLITLLAGIGVAAVLFLLSMQATGNGDAALQPAADPQVSLSAPPRVADPVQAAPQRSATSPAAPATSASSAAIDRETLAAPAPVTATWAGHLKPGTLAIAAKDGTAIAYLCDGKRVEAWLKGVASDGRLALTGKKEARLDGTYDEDAGKASGTVRVGERTWKFSITKVKKPGGLYRAAANVRGAKIVGGWIVLRDGTQVGLATVNGTLKRPSALDLTTGTATIDGIQVTAAPADGSR